MTVSPAPIRVMIADDHAVVRDGIQSACRKVTDIQIVGEAADGLQLLQQCGILQPDVVLMDIQMPLMDGIEATKQLLAILPQCSIIAFTMFGEETSLLEMLAAGASGYLLKQSRTADLLTAIRQVYPTGHYFCRETSRRLNQLIAQQRYDPRTRAQRNMYSDKEVQIIRLICEEASNKEIAVAMGLSVRTIEGYREKIQEKMNVKNTAGIVRKAMQQRIYVGWL